MFKTIRWRTFIKDLIVIQFGFALYGVAIALLIQANLGTSPWVIFSTAMSNILGISIGTMIIITGVTVLLGTLLLREPIGWGTLANIFFIGPWVDLWLNFIPSLTQQVFWQILMLISSVIILGIATAIYIGVDAGAGPRDSLMLGIARVSGLSLRMARGLVEITVSLVGWALGGPIGIGTLIFALLIGPSVQWAFKIFKVKATPAPSSSI